MLTENRWPCGATDKASDYESGDSRFESWQGRIILSHTQIDFIPNFVSYQDRFTAINAHRKPVALWRNGLGI